MPKTMLHQLAQSGAADGQVPMWDGTEWVASDVSGSGSGGVVLLTPEDFGGVGDWNGSTGTDNSSALQDMFDAVPSDGGAVWLGGQYLGAGVTIDNPTTVLGAQAGWYPGQDSTSQLVCPSATEKLLTVNAHGTNFRHVNLRNVASGSVTDGAGIYVAAGDVARYEDVNAYGFWVNLHVEDGDGWTLENCDLHSPWKYGLLVRHTDSPDAGDQAISNLIITTGRNCDAALRYESGGGLKIDNLKINGSGGFFGRGIDVSWASASAVFLVDNCSIENVTGDGVRIETTSSGAEFGGVVLDGLQFGLYNGSGAPVRIKQTSGSLHHILINGVNARTDNGSNTNAIVELDSVDSVGIGPIVNDGFTAKVHAVSSTNVVDLNAAAAVPSTRTIAAGTGLAGGGDLSADRTLAIDTAAETERIQDAVGAMFVNGTGIGHVYDDAAGTLTVTATGGGGTRLVPMTTKVGGGDPQIVFTPDGEVFMMEVPT